VGKDGEEDEIRGGRKWEVKMFSWFLFNDSV
jgi:hypothetical protein